MRKSYSTTVIAKSGHTLFVKQIHFSDIPEVIREKGDASSYRTFYVVKNWDNKGVVFMYLAKGSPTAPKEIVAFYPKGGFWSSYGLTIEDAINGAQRDGWMYA